MMMPSSWRLLEKQGLMQQVDQIEKEAAGMDLVERLMDWGRAQAFTFLLIYQLFCVMFAHQYSV